MQKFKVGDKVKILKGQHKGQTGQVFAAYKGSRYCVMLPGKDGGVPTLPCFNTDYLEKIS